MPIAKKLTATTKVAPEKKVKRIVPKNPNLAADKLYETQQERYALDRQSKELKSYETEIRTYLIEKLDATSGTVAGGTIARATVVMSDLFVVTDWDKVHEYFLKNIKKNPGLWAIFKRELIQSTVAEMWKAGIKIDGVKQDNIKKISLNKV